MVNLRETLQQAAEDNTAFREVYDLTIDRVYAFILGRVKNHEQALDICQNSYLALWQSLPRFEYRGEAYFWAFLWKIVRRQISRSRVQTGNILSLEAVFDLPAEIETFEDYRVLLKEMSELGENERLCLELRYFQDLTFADIAQVLETTENNAKVIHHRAIRKLKDKLPNYE